MKALLQRLRAEIRADRDAFSVRLHEISAADLRSARVSAGTLAEAAVALHHAYGALESVMARIAQVLEGSVPQGPDWHQTLLTDMGLEIEGVRPAVFARPTVALLRRLLAFRHFFRHAYAVELDAARLAALRDDAVVMAPLVETDLDRFDKFVEDLARNAAD